MPGHLRRLAVLAAGALLSGCGLVGPAPAVPSHPVASVEPSTVATASPAPTPSVAASAPPTAVPTAAPTPDPSILDLAVTSCPGGVVLHWSASMLPEFHHYTALRSPERDIATAYPPIAPAVDWGDTYATDRFVTSGADASIIPSATRWFYRVMAYDAAGAVIGASNVRRARLHDVADLAPLEVATVDGASTLTWTPFHGRGDCFSHYRILTATSGLPSTVLAVVSGQRSASWTTTALHPGTTYALKVQAMRTTTLGSFAVGETEVVVYTVP